MHSTVLPCMKLVYFLQVLCQEVHAATVLSLLVVADRHEASELKSTCVKVILVFLSLSWSPIKVLFNLRLWLSEVRRLCVSRGGEMSSRYLFHIPKILSLQLECLMET